MWLRKAVRAETGMALIWIIFHYLYFKEKLDLREPVATEFRDCSRQKYCTFANSHLLWQIYWPHMWASVKQILKLSTVLITIKTFTNQDLEFNSRKTKILLTLVLCLFANLTTILFGTRPFSHSPRDSHWQIY